MRRCGPAHQRSGPTLERSGPERLRARFWLVIFKTSSPSLSQEPEPARFPEKRFNFLRDLFFFDRVRRAPGTARDPRASPGTADWIGYFFHRRGSISEKPWSSPPVLSGATRPGAAPPPSPSPQGRRRGSTGNVRTSPPPPGSAPTVSPRWPGLASRDRRARTGLSARRSRSSRARAPWGPSTPGSRPSSRATPLGG